jgi:hypothetical protein
MSPIPGDIERELYLKKRFTTRTRLSLRQALYRNVSLESGSQRLKPILNIRLSGTSETRALPGFTDFKRDYVTQEISYPADESPGL